MSETWPKTKGLSNMEDSTSSTYTPATNSEKRAVRPKNYNSRQVDSGNTEGIYF